MRSGAKLNVQIMQISYAFGISAASFGLPKASEKGVYISFTLSVKRVFSRLPSPKWPI
jgi:hypothetical protein